MKLRNFMDKVPNNTKNEKKAKDGKFKKKKKN